MTYVPAQRFHLYEKQCGNEWVSEVGGVGEEGHLKMIQKCLGINKILTLTSPKNSSQNAITVGIF